MSFQRVDEWGYGTWGATGVGTNAGVTVTHTITTNANKCYVTGAQFSGDAAALVTIESPSGTAIWRKRYAAAFADSVSFAALPAALQQNVLVKISASTTNSEANIQGYDV